jgi:hypothetical protein
MRTTVKMASGLLLSLAFLGSSIGAPFKPAPDSAPLQLKDGPNDIKVGDMTVRIIKAFVSNGTASSFDTYTLFVLPGKADEPWRQVTVPSNTGIGYNFRNYETGDSNIQSISFFQQGGQLFAVEAAKAGQVPQVNLSKAGIDFQIFKFNQNWDIPKFDPEGVMHAKGKYMDAGDALTKEFYSFKKNSR